jgi:CubicO group peptidase (beta-lactamase class C family)
VRFSRICFFALPLIVAAAGPIASARSEDAAAKAREAVPVFSATGPDAAFYGAAAGYPLGTRESGGEPQHLVATYSHFDELVPSRRVARAASPWNFKRAAEPAFSYTFESKRLSLDDYMSRNPATGLLIAKDDTILYEHYQYARSDRDRFLSQSMAKTITAMLVGIAVSEGKIKSIEDSAAAYVPGLADIEYGKTQLRDLLHMASGVAFSENYDGNDDIARLSRDLFNQPGKDPVASLAQFNTRVAPPATKFHYSSAETEILGLVLRAATGMPIADYLHEKIWAPIGTEADASWAIDGTGQEVTFCCFNAVLRDYARLGRLLAHDGAWEGRQLIPRQWLLDFGYGYQTWILPGAQRRFALIGIRGQTILVDPATKLVLVHTAVRPKPAEEGSFAELITLWFHLLAQLGK